MDEDEINEMPSSYFESESSDNEEPVKAVAYILEPLAIVLITVMIFLANTVNIVALSTEKSLRNKHGYFLLSLAISDLCTSFVAAFSIYPSIKREWTFPHVLCEITAFFQGYLTEVSLTMTVGMSVERYIAVFYPLQIRRWLTKKRCLQGIIGAWVGMFVLNIMFCFNQYIDIEYDGDIFACVPDTGSEEHVFLIVSQTVVEIPALFIVSYMSARVVVHMWWRGRRHSRGHAGSFIDSISSPRVQSRQTATALKIIITITLTFYVTWIPFIVLRLWHVKDIEETSQEDINHWAEFFTYWLMISSGFTNVFVYCFIHEKFRTHLKALCKKITANYVAMYRNSNRADDHAVELSHSEEYRGQHNPREIWINEETITTSL